MELKEVYSPMYDVYFSFTGDNLYYYNGNYINKSVYKDLNYVKGIVNGTNKL